MPLTVIMVIVLAMFLLPVLDIDHSAKISLMVSILLALSSTLDFVNNKTYINKQVRNMFVYLCLLCKVFYNRDTFIVIS